MRDDISIAGGWLGTYRYGGLESMRRPVRFEATFRTVGILGSQLDGEILDDCALGPAELCGQQSGTVVRFTKHYRRTGLLEHTGRIDYAGLMSDDGTVMRGSWQLQSWAHGLLIVRGFGAWDARRQWREIEDESDEAQGSGRERSAADW